MYDKLIMVTGYTGVNKLSIYVLYVIPEKNCKIILKTTPCARATEIFRRITDIYNKDLLINLPIWSKNEIHHYSQQIPARVTFIFNY